MSKNILITGGAGFIGSHVVRLFINKYPNYNIINLDKLTYAGNLENLKDIERAHAKGKELTLQTALTGMSIPLHPGAEKFFKEKGVAK